MNILLFVTSLLMILSLLTYTRIDNFRYFLGMQSEFERYMRSMERVYINDSAEQWYKSTIAKGAGTTNEPAKPAAPAQPAPDPKPAGRGLHQPQNPHPDGEAPAELSNPKPPPSSTPTSHLSFRIIIDPKMRAADEPAYQQTVEWLKQLMKTLYGDQLFFKRMMEERPDFLNELITAIQNAVEALKEDKRPTHIEDLANLDIGGDLEDVFYLMLKGCPREDLLNIDLPKIERPNIIETNVPNESVEEDEADIANESEEYLSPQGYNSLLNYINLRNTTKVRVYLASRDLLTAIFGQPQIADEIIKARYNLYRSVINGGMTSTEASAQFQATFHGIESINAQPMLDFKVTKTNPNEYITNSH